MKQQLFRLAPLDVAAAVSVAACNRQETAPAKTEAAPAPAKAAAAPAADVIKIGHVAPLTGGIAHLGKDNENGARLAVEEINAAGGLKVGDKTYKLDLVAEDDKPIRRKAHSPHRNRRFRAVAVVGHLNSGTSIPASKIYSMQA